MKIFLMKSESFLTLDSNTTDTFKSQKASKDTVKIVHVISVVQPSFYKDTRILFERKEYKNSDFFWVNYPFNICLKKKKKH